MSRCRRSANNPPAGRPPVWPGSLLAFLLYSSAWAAAPAQLPAGPPAAQAAPGPSAPQAASEDPPAPPPAASAATDGATGHWQRGVDHFDHLRYEAAVAEFRQAYAQRKEPRVLYLLGQSLRKLGRHDEARAALTEYVLIAPAQRDRDFIRAAQVYLERLQQPGPPRPGWLTVRSDRRAARVLVDGHAAGQTPLLRLSLSAGLHNITGQHGGQEVTAAAQVFPGQEHVLQLRFPIPRAAWIATGVLSALALAGAATGLGLYYGTTVKVPDGTVAFP